MTGCWEWRNDAWHAALPFTVTHQPPPHSPSRTAPPPLQSFVESNGTVLSTNWSEVGTGTVEGSAPKGMEMHDWNERNR